MLKFLLLTAMDGETVHLHPQGIIAFRTQDEEHATLIDLANDTSWYVRETPDQILELLDAIRADHEQRTIDLWKSIKV